MDGTARSAETASSTDPDFAAAGGLPKKGLPTTAAAVLIKGVYSLHQQASLKKYTFQVTHQICVLRASHETRGARVSTALHAGRVSPLLLVSLLQREGGGGGIKGSEARQQSEESHRERERRREGGRERPNGILSYIIYIYTRELLLLLLSCDRKKKEAFK